MDFIPERIIEDVLNKNGVHLSETEVEIARIEHESGQHKDMDLVNFICSKFLVKQSAVVTSSKIKSNGSESNAGGIYPKVETVINSNNNKAGIYPQVKSSVIAATTTPNNSPTSIGRYPRVSKTNHEDEMKDMKRLEDIISDLQISQRAKNQVIEEGINLRRINNSMIESHSQRPQPQNVQDELIKSSVRTISSMVNSKVDLVTAFSSTENLRNVVNDLNAVVEAIPKGNSHIESQNNLNNEPRHVRSCMIKNKLKGLPMSSNLLNLKKISDMSLNQLDNFTVAVNNISKMYGSDGELKGNEDWVRIAQSEAYKISSHHKGLKIGNYKNGSHHVRKITEDMKRQSEDLLSYALLHYVLRNANFSKLEKYANHSEPEYFSKVSVETKDVVNKILGRIPDSQDVRVGFAYCQTFCQSAIDSSVEIQIKSNGRVQGELKNFIDTKYLVKGLENLRHLIQDYEKGVNHSSHEANSFSSSSLSKGNSIETRHAIHDFVSRFKSVISNTYFGDSESTITHSADIVFNTALTAFYDSAEILMDLDYHKSVLFLECVFHESFFMALNFIASLVIKGMKSGLASNDLAWARDSYTKLYLLMSYVR